MKVLPIIILAVFLLFADGGSLLLAENSWNSCVAPVSEPVSMLFLGSGLIGVAVFGRKKFFK
jgi:hypothetical protein